MAIHQIVHGREDPSQELHQPLRRGSIGEGGEIDDVHEQDRSRLVSVGDIGLPDLQAFGNGSGRMFSSDSERAKATSRCRTKYTTTARLTSEALARTNTKSAVWIAVGSGSTGAQGFLEQGETNSSATQAAARQRRSGSPEDERGQRNGERPQDGGAALRESAAPHRRTGFPEAVDQRRAKEDVAVLGREQESEQGNGDDDEYDLDRGREGRSKITKIATFWSDRSATKVTTAVVTRFANRSASSSPGAKPSSRYARSAVVRRSTAARIGSAQAGADQGVGRNGGEQEGQVDRGVAEQTDGGRAGGW